MPLRVPRASRRIYAFLSLALAPGCAGCGTRGPNDSQSTFLALNPGEWINILVAATYVSIVLVMLKQLRHSQAETESAARRERDRSRGERRRAIDGLLGTLEAVLQRDKLEHSDAQRAADDVAEKFGQPKGAPAGPNSRDAAIAASSILDQIEPDRVAAAMIGPEAARLLARAGAFLRGAIDGVEAAEATTGNAQTPRGRRNYSGESARGFSAGIGELRELKRYLEGQRSALDEDEGTGR